ncbi:alpha glucosidase [Linderina pennispora]|uniref:Probable alpha/beta-glucosidase agdC n=1 Tax=Linderina pennispora TaxID=61395 RepID=A0A1Y1W7Z4_9FUNG|nr:alpha glucosidase [Linderina pennispora]ORX69562.1 alpha glucosidase [Linderina pennispora]
MLFKYSILALLVQAIAVRAHSDLGKRGNIASCPGYKIVSKQDMASGFSATLKLAGKPCNAYGNDVSDLKLNVDFDSQDRLHVHVQDSAGKQYQIPASVLKLDASKQTNKSKASLKFNYFQDAKHGFGFKVSRGKDTVFDTTGHPLIFEDQYIEVTSNLPSNANIYGIGETPDWFRRDTANTIKTLWNRDAADPFQENVYGSHSIHMELRNGKFHDAYLHNSHGMDIVLANNTIQYRVLGGTADFYFFNGPTALDVIDQYTELVGCPNRIPYWALGFQNCRYGYKSVYEVNDVIANYSKAEIPLEVAWTDIDYMDRTRDFTFDPVNFPLSEMQKQLEYLHAHNQKMVLMTDPAIQRNSSYGPYARGLEQDAFVKNSDGSVFVGQVWPGYTAFPDWFAPNADKWWSGELKRYFDALPIDGMWIDMNEAANFCTGSCGSGIPEDVVPEYPWKASPPPVYRPLNASNLILAPPYAIHNPASELSNKTIETTALHANGVLDYHVHNIYGLMMSIATRKFLTNHRPNIRPFLLSRSTFAGSGALVNHWTGDNASTFKDLHVSIASMLDFGIFGIPMVGADICGFNLGATEELCARWIEVGAFYPFSRNHNAIGEDPQELYRWESVAEASRRALTVRYTLLPYFYTNYQHAVENGWPVARPLVFQYPEIAATSAIDKQFLIGDGLLISPVLTQGAVTVDAFFPKGIWYDWYTYKAVKGENKEITLDAPLEHVNVHVRGGAILPAQVPAMTTTDSRKNDYYLVVAVDERGRAEGKLYLDDGETFDTPHRWISLEYKNVAPKLTKVVLLGVDNVKTVRVGGASQSAAKILSENGSTTVEGLSIDLNRSASISFK